ncbi:hypothetical protein [Ahrensia marina]|uniref:Uncharacterized protein n=1 Tax=Ahrensia marina TaxID=1514904 RepID=A0A0M9GPM1_9HYPH|nr:hypothetical protein [Ahrensia marina]KPB02730.1 hypothetical protein SU32_00085 [Ahrensia marina]
MSFRVAAKLTGRAKIASSGRQIPLKVSILRKHKRQIYKKESGFTVCSLWYYIIVKIVRLASKRLREAFDPVLPRAA